MSLMSLWVTITTGMISVGCEIDCKSWARGARAEVTITLTATDGGKNRGMFTLAGDVEPLDLQILLVSALEQEGWAVKPGKDHTVIAFAPRGQSVASIKIVSDVWVPKYKPIIGIPRIPK
jgi:hypothetical protein